MKPLSVGKLPIVVLESTFLKLTGAHSADVATPPKAGLDFAAIRAGARFMIVSSDPVTGVSKNIGRYAIDVNANDVATSGTGARFAESVVLLPEGANMVYAKRIAVQMDAEARKLGIGIVGGHTEVTPGLHRPIVIVTAFSFTDSYVSSADARSGDTIMMTKTAGIEGTAVLSGDESWLDRISITDEAVSAFRTGEVHAMHDCTEGGVLGAVFEMSRASGLGFELEEGRVPVAPETRRLCRKLGIDPLRLIGSGALLLSVEEGREDEVKRALSPTKATAIGKFTPSKRLLVRRGGHSQVVGSAPEDELWRVLGSASRRRQLL